MTTKLPTHVEAGRVYLRRYEAGDGRLFYAMSQKPAYISPSLSTKRNIKLNHSPMTRPSPSVR